MSIRAEWVQALGRADQQDLLDLDQVARSHEQERTVLRRLQEGFTLMRAAEAQEPRAPFYWEGGRLVGNGQRVSGDDPYLA